jgi:hypothetical protein
MGLSSRLTSPSIEGGKSQGRGDGNTAPMEGGANMQTVITSRASALLGTSPSKTDRRNMTISKQGAMISVKGK